MNMMVPSTFLRMASLWFSGTDCELATKAMTASAAWLAPCVPSARRCVLPPPTDWGPCCSASCSTLRNAATFCGLSFSSGVKAQSMARNTASPKAWVLALPCALGMSSSRTRDADSKGLRPVAIQYMTAPSEYRSVQGPWLPLLWYCSNGAKPGLTILVISCAPVTRRAAPKSNSTGVPSARI